MLLRWIHHGFVCIFNRSPSQVKRGFGPLLPVVDCGNEGKKYLAGPAKVRGSRFGPTEDQA
jgi:hypothetical protein